MAVMVVSGIVFCFEKLSARNSRLKCKLQAKSREGLENPHRGEFSHDIQIPAAARYSISPFRIAHVNNGARSYVLGLSWMLLRCVPAVRPGIPSFGVLLSDQCFLSGTAVLRFITPSRMKGVDAAMTLEEPGGGDPI